ncbi:MAG TPA: tRNA lysidine(34) synthetase TilS [Candidatus Saccharimonadales bacterium]
MRSIDLKANIYIVAVSGGVDSVVLLDLLSRQTELELIVAHFDHGIRVDSGRDRQFVSSLAKKYKHKFESAEGQLGPDASEAKARAVRYKFLKQVKSKHRAVGIVTAHHQDDIIETAIINLIRGTGPKGLSALKSSPALIRPLLNWTKADIIKYARRGQLSWREDPTNQDTSYLRNYIRRILIPKLTQADANWRPKFLSAIEINRDLGREIEPLIKSIAADNIRLGANQAKMARSWLVGLPGLVGREMIAHMIRAVDKKVRIDRRSITAAWQFAKTARSGKTKLLGKTTVMTINNGEVLVGTKAPS